MDGFDFFKGGKFPRITVDIIIEYKEGIILIERKYPPAGWAIPGGFVNYGETVEHAAIREAKEETSLDVELIRQFHCYSDLQRDPRGHTITTVFIARGKGEPKAEDDAKAIGIFNKEKLPPLAFDHALILKDYFSKKY